MILNDQYTEDIDGNRLMEAMKMRMMDDG